MKILLVANKDITLYLLRKEFIEKLLELNYEITILCPHGDKLEYFQKNGCKLIDYKIDRRGKNPLKEISILFRFNKVIKKLKPDFIFTYTIKPNIYVGIIARFRNIKFIPTITGLGSALNSKTFVSTLLNNLYRFSFKKSYVVVFQNKTNQTWFRKNINNKVKSILVNGSGVNLSKFIYSEPQTTKQTSFLFLGRIMKEKGIDEFIQASKIIKEKYGDSIIVKLAGYFEDDYNELIKELERSNIVQYLGFVEDTFTLIRSCSVVVLPSYHEGLSNVLLEAQAIGRPVIASDIPGCTETFIQGLSGFNVKLKDANDLANKMEEFHKLDFKSKIQMGLYGRKHVETNFDRNSIINEYLKILM